jgi:hypothetical protein
MKKYILAICLLLGGAAAAFTYNPPQESNCMKDCSASLKACLDHTPATDREQENARRQACYDRDKECRKNCGGSGRSPN